MEIELAAVWRGESWPLKETARGSVASFSSLTSRSVNSRYTITLYSSIVYTLQKVFLILTMNILVCSASAVHRTVPQGFKKGVCLTCAVSESPY
jgi:hypothetical protein